MVELALLTSTVVMGLLLVLTAFAVSAFGSRRDSRAKLPVAGGRRPADAAGGDGVHPGIKLGVPVVAVGAVVAGAVVVADGVASFIVLIAALLLAYLSWGVYYMARVRGLPRAHSVGLSAWVFGVMLVAVVAGKLLFG
jgi:hypothetical protein